MTKPVTGRLNAKDTRSTALQNRRLKHIQQVSNAVYGQLIRWGMNNTCQESENKALKKTFSSNRERQRMSQMARNMTRTTPQNKI
jgi:hypothetical protein